ncbi:MAG: oligosaccharide flippase family protein [Candidatus Eisenbacteria bacterium]|nr:oligosaccharide flippase family protein [Candidatus Eisenbacteria bacterium]
MHPRRFLRDSIFFATSQYVFRVLLMARGLIAARLLGPVTYGAWNAIQLVMDYGMLATAGTFQGLDQTLPPRLVDGDAEAIRRTKSSGLFNVLLLSSLYAIGTVVYFTFSNGKIKYFWGMRGMIVAGVCVVLSNLGSYRINLLRAHNNMTAVSGWYLVQGVIGAGLALALMPRFGMWALLGGWLVGTVIASIVSQWQARHIAPFAPQASSECLALLRAGAPMYLYSASVILRSLDRVIIIKCLNTISLGYYSLAVTAMTLLLYLPDSVSFVLYPQLLKRYREGGDRPEAVRSQVERTYQTLAVMTPVLCGVTFLWSRDLMFVLLPKFLPGLPALRLMCFGAGGIAFVGFSAIVLMTLRRQAFLVPVALAGSLLGAALDLVAVRLGSGITGVACATLIAYVLNGVVMSWMAFAGLRGTTRGVPARVLRTFMPLAISYGLAFGIDRLVPWPGAESLTAHAGHMLVELALFLPLYSVLAYPFGRGTGLRQMMTDLRPAWMRRADSADA